MALQWMIYGANGYSGELIAREAVRRGHLPILAGRNEERIIALAQELGLRYKIFDLKHAYKAQLQLQDIGVVLNCAGPFELTASVLRTACLLQGVHYLDITGEIDVLEQSLACHEQARACGVVVISGVGFDVVPSDVLAVKAQQLLPTATHLQLAFAGNTGFSPGTAKTSVNALAAKGKIRRDGIIVTVPLAYQAKVIAFYDKARYAMTIPWGDIATAFHSTGIANIEVFMATKPKQVKSFKRLNYVSAILGLGIVRKLLHAYITKNIQGPNLQQREQGRMQLWAEVSDGTETRHLTLETPEGYTLTVLSSLYFVEALLADKIMPGAFTPTQAVDCDALLELQALQLHSSENTMDNKPSDTAMLNFPSESAMKKQLEIMLQLQDNMNKKVHPEWRAQNFAWFRAIWIECGELVDHYGYKWWKKQTPDMQQVQLEVVDIWHFGLSMLIDGRDFALLSENILQSLQRGEVEQLEAIDATEALAESILATREFDVCKFWALMLACDLSFDDLFKQYVGKNVLNFFRQDHGYKDGSYIKVWLGREDNEHLSEILASTEVGDDFADVVYQQLAAIYQQL